MDKEKGAPLPDKLSSIKLPSISSLNITPPSSTPYPTPIANEANILKLNTLPLPLNAVPNSKYIIHNRPPLRIDYTFYQQKDNQRKLIQLATGAFCFLMTRNCFPNVYAGYCMGELFSFVQLFQLVCVTGFCFCVTTVLLGCSIIGAHDTFYHYNFEILERLYTSMASCLYAIGMFGCIVEMLCVRFSVIWPFQIGSIFAVLTAYSYDCMLRWQSLRG